ncbi:YajQ family cyclic di-GMP-binding protein [Ferrimicrobium acidiphilum]|uniref:YajQ family cyclic di-GMP-binding protein n=1 Tax=Ferrimicrobium acidiphilum TaxID=121039 RepID=UPI0023F4B974|nr:YajQ family cyclic di-GMP-binding protein [Ferrimicrobium acidiphilum]
MPSFDVVSEIDIQEVKNAVDQASREITTRFDFKNTDSSIVFNENDLLITLASSTPDRLKAVMTVLEERLVKRSVSLKALDRQKVEDASKGTVRQAIRLVSGLDGDRAKQVTHAIKAMGMKGIQAQIQGDQVRVTGKKRDDLQAVMGQLKEQVADIPLQFVNFRD